MAAIALEDVMDRDAQTETIRRLVLRTVAGWEGADAQRSPLRMSEVVRDGMAIGRKFEIDGVRAIWLWDRDVVIFWGSAGQMLKAVSASETLAAQARVA